MLECRVSRDSRGIGRAYLSNVDPRLRTLSFPKKRELLAKLGCRFKKNLNINSEHSHCRLPCPSAVFFIDSTVSIRCFVSATLVLRRPKF